MKIFATSISFCVVTPLFPLSETDLGAEFQKVIPLEVITNIEKHISTNTWGAIYYDVLPKIIQEQHFKTFVEIGVALGGHAETILKNSDIESYYGIDPYLYNYDPDDSFGSDVAKYSSHDGQKNFDYLYSWVKEYRIKPFQNRFKLIRECSVKAASLFDDESIDCIFVDGDHRYEAVLKDLEAWLPKLKTGGLMIGDDYWMTQVAAAVDQFFAAKNIKVFFFTAKSGYKLWAIYK